MAAKLGRLEKVDLRAVWNNEASDFTPWLAQEENLALLGETIGLDLELEAREKPVGPYRADILCKDTLTDAWVLIENQIERTDHNHLGQILTYAAGLDAVTIVWVARQFTEEHRAALDWLNEITDDEINFFGLEVELWRIGESNIAPKFNLVSQPNEWVRQVKAEREHGELTPTRLLELEYWTAFREHLTRAGSYLKSQKPYPQHWTNVSIGRSNFHIEVYVNTKRNMIGMYLAIGGPDAKAYFHLLKREISTIEAELGCSLSWDELPKKKSSYISLNGEGFNPADRNDWPRQHQWLRERLEAFYTAFVGRVKALNAEDYYADQQEGSVDGTP